MATTQPEVPEWETPTSPPKKSIFRKPVALQSFSLSKEEPGEDATTVKRTFSDHLPHGFAACFGRSRKQILLSLLAFILLLILILGLGLGLGLSHKSKKAQNLPLPTNRGIFTGDLTFYSPGPGYGSCGYQNTSTESICAVSHLIFDAASTSSNSNNNPLCGKMIRITRYDATVGGNRSVDVEVVDRCVGCKATDLDLSLSMFTSLAEESQGRVVGSWAWLN
ncbi:uncharacterized protein K444DRAFT_586751 [Hyaloscypha bicolor E]|uniref:RlpA-like protein double-psi beta-barrel domain-containing protein n=1 Tax=Hyaloscypha bicolor E TaxID=1095630 RepID=A0A2J6TG30_9HELO|nr:uncharacterized protein K444DRAFT_586751 [Hyaloscypha bicolor E]PMD61970.1 hypothetical protein K444DRAFT_586751 [Hyaloscypha bicolor E]